MCEITVIKYVHSDGRKETVEKKKLCSRSEGGNPCYNHNRREITRSIPSGTPSLTYETPSPMSASIPGTPILATAPHYEIREPTGLHRSGSKGKGKAKPFQIGFTSRRKKSRSPRRKSSAERYNQYDDEDEDPIVTIEDHGMVEPRTPTHRQPPSFGSPMTSRLRRQPPIINQAIPPPPVDSFRPVSQPSYHRRNSTAPESIQFNSDHEIMERANAREELRRQNTEYRRRQDEEKRQREEADRKLAQQLQEKERQEQAMDEFSRKDYERLQEKDARRRRELEEKEKQRLERAEIERLHKDIQESKQREQKRKQVEEEQRQSEDARRREERRREERQRMDEQREERVMQEELDRHRRERLSATATDLRNIQSQINKLESQLRASEERKAARERAERLEQEIRRHDQLEAEIAQIEGLRRDHDLEKNESELRQMEAEYNRLNARVRERETASGSVYDSLDGPRQGERRNIGMAPSSFPVEVLQRLSPFQNQEYRRAIGEQVLERERSRAGAQASAYDLQGAPSSGLTRRNTIGTGSNRTREQRYRDLRKWYPE
jgi:hypothetical protein